MPSLEGVDEFEKLLYREYALMQIDTLWKWVDPKTGRLVCALVVLRHDSTT